MSIKNLLKCSDKIMIITVMTKLYLMLDICQNFKSFIAFNFHCNQMKLIRVSHPQHY